MQAPRSFGSRPAHQRAEPARRSSCGLVPVWPRVNDAKLLAREGNSGRWEPS